MTTPGPWQTPNRPGPNRLHVAGALLFAIAAFATWAMLGTGSLRWSSLDQRANVTLRIDTDGEGTADGARVTSRTFARSGDTPYVVIRADVDRAVIERAEKVTIDVDIAGGIDPDTASLRVDAPQGRLRLSRTATSAPRVVVTRPSSGDQPIEVIFAAPVDDLLPNVDIADAPTIRSQTHAFDERVQQHVVQAKRHRWIREHALWIAVLFGLLAIAPPLVWWHRARGRVFGSDRLPGGKVAAATTLSVPTGDSAVRIAILNAGAARIDGGDALAAHVLEALQLERWGALRLDWSADGAGTTVRPPAGTSDPLDLAAAELLRAVALGETSGTAWIADAPKIGGDPASATSIAAARVHWRRALDEAARSIVVRSAGEPRHARSTRAAAAAFVGTLIFLIAGFVLDVPWHAAVAWLIATTTLVSGMTLAGMALDQAKWRRVSPRMASARSAWLGWRRAIVDRSVEGERADPRSRPYAIAMSIDLPDMPTRPGAGAVGAAAVGDDTIASMRRTGRGSSS